MKVLGVTCWLAGLAVAGWCLAQTTPPARPGPASAGEGPPSGESPRRNRPVVAPATQPERPQVRSRPGVFVRRAATPLTEQQRRQVIEFLQAEQPGLFRKLQKAREEDPKRYAMMLNRAGRSTLYLLELKRGNPELYALYLEDLKTGRKIARLAAAIRKAADPANESKLVSQLRGELVRRFDLAQDRQRLQISQFQRRIDRLEAMLRARQANKDKIIEQQLQQILKSGSLHPASMSGRPGGRRRPISAVRVHRHPPARPRPASAGEPPPPKQPLRLRRPEGPPAAVIAQPVPTTQPE